MGLSLFVAEAEGHEVRVCRDLVRIRTERPVQFVDLTALVAERVRRSRVGEGIVVVQSRHTTAAVVVNEDEPRLLDDFAELLERWAPHGRSYRHDDLAAREGPLEADERRNGHAHARALLLGASACLNVAEGDLDLGRWQRVLLLELDGPRERTVSVQVLGVTPGATSPSRPR